MGIIRPKRCQCVHEVRLEAAHSWNALTVIKYYDRNPCFVMNLRGNIHQVSLRCLERGENIFPIPRIFSECRLPQKSSILMTNLLARPSVHNDLMSFSKHKVLRLQKSDPTYWKMTSRLSDMQYMSVMIIWQKSICVHSVIIYQITHSSNYIIKVVFNL